MNGDNNRIDAAIKGFIDRRFEIIKILGNGGEGTVYKCKSINWGINDQKQFALKCQRFCKDDEIEFIDNIIVYQNQYENEICQGQLNYQSSGLIRIYERFQSNNSNFILMELGELDLYHYLQQQQNLTIESKIKIMIQVNILTYSQITQAISYLHSKNLIHRDIKPENFIKVSDQFKLIDFGLTRKNEGRQMTQNQGTPLFQSPEIVENSQNYTQAVDIWSLGCVFYEILTNTPLIEGCTQFQIQNRIKNCKNDINYLKNKLEQLPVQAELKKLLMLMLQPFHEDRIQINVVMEQLKSISQKYNNNKVQFIQTDNNQNHQQGFNQQNTQLQKQLFNPQPLKHQNIQQFQQGSNNEIKQLQDSMKDMESKLNSISQSILEINQNQNNEIQFKNVNQEQFNKIWQFMQTFQKDQIQEISRFMYQNQNELQQQIKDQFLKQQEKQNEHFHNLQAQISQQMAKQEQQTSQLQLKEQQINKLQQEQINQNKEKQTLIQNYDQKLKKLENDLEVSQNKNTQQEERLKVFQNQNDSKIEQEIRNLSQTIKQLQKELLNLQDNQKLIQNNEIAEEYKIKVKQQCQNNEYQAQIENMKNHIFEQNQTIEQVKSDNQQLREQIKKLETTNKTNQEKLQRQELEGQQLIKNQTNQQFSHSNMSQNTLQEEKSGIYRNAQKSYSKSPTKQQESNMHQKKIPFFDQKCILMNLLKKHSPIMLIDKNRKN